MKKNPLHPQRVWAIVSATTGRLVMFDGRCPIYWHRRPAMIAMRDHGLLNPERYEVRPMQVVPTPEQVTR